MTSEDSDNQTQGSSTRFCGTSGGTPQRPAEPILVVKFGQSAGDRVEIKVEVEVEQPATLATGRLSPTHEVGSRYSPL